MPTPEFVRVPRFRETVICRLCRKPFIHGTEANLSVTLGVKELDECFDCSAPQSFEPGPGTGYAYWRDFSYLREPPSPENES